LSEETSISNAVDEVEVDDGAIQRKQGSDANVSHVIFWRPQNVSAPSAHSLPVQSIVVSDASDDADVDRLEEDEGSPTHIRQGKSSVV